MKRSTLVRLANVHVGATDVIRRRSCDWCAAGVVTVEKIIGLITPPKEDRIEEIEKAKAQSKHGGLRNPWD